MGQVKLSSSKDRGTEEYLRKSKIGVVSRVISATESDSEESERLHFLPPPLMTLSLTIEWKPDCQSQSTFPRFVTGLVFLLLLATSIT